MLFSILIAISSTPSCMSPVFVVYSPNRFDGPTIISPLFLFFRSSAMYFGMDMLHSPPETPGGTGSMPMRLLGNPKYCRVCGVM